MGIDKINYFNQGYSIYSVSCEKKPYSGRNSATNGRQRGRQGGKLKISRNINASVYMIRIAQAKTPSQVAAVIRTARADMQFVKSCNSEASQIDKADRILKQVIVKSQTKIRRLRKEEELERQEMLARGAKKRELANRIREKKNKKQRARSAQENADTLTNEEARVERTILLEAYALDAPLTGTDSFSQEGMEAADTSIEALL